MAKNNFYLVDTNIFIWWMEGGQELSNKIIEILKNPQHLLFLSVVSIWEIVIKKRLNKIRPPKDWKETLNKSEFKILPVEIQHAFELESLSLHHKDPFDRMLVAQAKVEGLCLISGDEKVLQYDKSFLRA